MNFEPSSILFLQKRVKFRVHPHAWLKRSRPLRLITDARIRPLEPYRRCQPSPPLYAAPHGCEPLRATLPDLSSPQGRPRLAGVVNYISLARQRITTFPLPLTKARHRIPSHCLPVILRPAICGISSCARRASSPVSFDIVPMCFSPLSVVSSRPAVFRLMQPRLQRAFP